MEPQGLEQGHTWRDCCSGVQGDRGVCVWGPHALTVSLLMVCKAQALIE